MTAEDKILYRLSKARKKEERLLEALKKVEPKEKSEATHDPGILTPEDHLFSEDGTEVQEICANWKTWDIPRCHP
ncbi:hypothetical protein RND71_013035 [Anisodus tanguticus]|uniref:Uncharacterized protein n=1 Tax=Anisodus tanguticus TaxID=243964 RepID=A0AAE1SH32_9SOLA|nr:hypothetical protein RND71_013035 [Anisodus tanguticus]